ncbi:hypothetical protein NT01EI_2445 [Edwardsiella ictaluri 93-146]|uniref:Uncharacterized protein n=1 Tax=Edwardsiella ictaluri (strain 93-146) TaxID=634503 RepID=C5BAD5_EDWI9|nr:hypothetical protein NT01EI_2445 [Edwardsiella ictaluri 93-146]
MPAAVARRGECEIKRLRRAIKVVDDVSFSTRECIKVIDGAVNPRR